MESQIYSPMMSTPTIKTNRVCGVILTILKAICLIVLLSLMSFYIYGQVSTNTVNENHRTNTKHSEVRIEEIMNNKTPVTTTENATSSGTTTSTTTTTSTISPPPAAEYDE